MKAVDLLSTNDAMVWAEEFVKTAKENNWKLEDIDEGLMVGWFANAMAAQENKDRKNTEHIQAEAIGWAYADSCATLDSGGDPRQTDMADVLERAKIDLAMWQTLPNKEG